MLLGNDKLPTFAGIGHVNFYMCQVRLPGLPVGPQPARALHHGMSILRGPPFQLHTISLGLHTPHASPCVKFKQGSVCWVSTVIYVKITQIALTPPPSPPAVPL